MVSVFLGICPFQLSYPIFLSEKCIFYSLLLLFTSKQWKAASCFLRPWAGSPLPGPAPHPGSASVSPAAAPGPSALLWAGPCSFRRGCAMGHCLDSGSCRHPEPGRAFGWAHGHCRPVVRASCLPLGLNLRQGHPPSFLARGGSSSLAHDQGCGTPLSIGFAVDVVVGWGGPQLPSCKMGVNTPKKGCAMRPSNGISQAPPLMWKS